MAFYEDLSAVYDSLFPVSAAQRALFDALIAEGWVGRVADAGCGSGAQLLHFAAAGLPAVGFDPDPSLVALAREKLRPYPSVAVARGGFGDTARLVRPPADLVLCLGNSLVHVPPAEAARFLRDAAAATTPAGGILVQILNYARLWREGTTELPPMEADGGAVAFRRRYAWEGPRRVRFLTELSVPGPQGRRTFANEIPLHPIYPDELAAMLAAAGFVRASRHGDFARSAFGPASEALVVLARKG